MIRGTAYTKELLFARAEDTNRTQCTTEEAVWSALTLLQTLDSSAPDLNPVGAANLGPNQNTMLNCRVSNSHWNWSVLFTQRRDATAGRANTIFKRVPRRLGSTQRPHQP